MVWGHTSSLIYTSTGNRRCHELQYPINLRPPLQKHRPTTSKTKPAGSPNYWQNGNLFLERQPLSTSNLLNSNSETSRKNWNSKSNPGCTTASKAVNPKYQPLQGQMSQYHSWVKPKTLQGEALPIKINQDKHPKRVSLTRNPENGQNYS